MRRNGNQKRQQKKHRENEQTSVPYCVLRNYESHGNRNMEGKRRRRSSKKLLLKRVFQRNEKAAKKEPDPESERMGCGR